MGDIGFFKMYKRPNNEVFNNITVYYNYAFKFGPLYIFCMRCQIEITSVEANITYSFNLGAIPMPVQLSNSGNIVIASTSTNNYDCFYPTYFTNIDFGTDYDTYSIRYKEVRTRYIEGGAQAPISLNVIVVVLNVR